MVSGPEPAWHRLSRWVGWRARMTWPVCPPEVFEPAWHRRARRTIALTPRWRLCWARVAGWVWTLAVVEALLLIAAGALWWLVGGE